MAENVTQYSFIDEIHKLECEIIRLKKKNRKLRQRLKPALPSGRKAK